MTSPSEPLPTRSSGRPDLSGAESRHAVQFFRREEFLVESVGAFAREALEAGLPFLLVAREPHREGIESHLRSAGFDLEALRAGGRLRVLDAAATLQRLTVGGRVDSERFRTVVGSAVRELGRSEREPVAAFGEMVALLQDAGETDAALELERFWNELGRTERLSLLCAYPLDAFRSDASGAQFEEICGAHSRVIPAEDFAEQSRPVEKSRAIARLQQRADRTEHDLADFLENAVEGVHRVGSDGRILWANKAELDMLGYSADEYIGRHIAEFHADKAAILHILGKLAAGETLRDEPATLLCKDGSVRHVRIHSNGLWENGKFIHTRSFTRDVSEQVRLERELRDRLDELAETSRRKDEFLAMLGHELRNPLAPIVTALDLMRVRRNDEELVSRSIELIDRQTRRLMRLVDDLLDVSRVTRGKMELKREIVSVRSLVERAVEQVHPLIEERGHRLSLDLTDEPIAVIADPTRLEQALANLLVNAAKYTQIGGKIVLRARRSGRQAEIVVQDDGVGLTQEAMKRIFELFEQAPGVPPGARTGLGVGLTLVKRLVELHEGSVEVSSEGPGKGSEFRVRLPLAARAAADAVDEAPRPEPRPAADSGRRILVVDDNLEAAEGLAELFRVLGHDARVRHGGAGAIEETLQWRPDFVFLDIGMPDVDGHEVARRLRADPRMASCVLVAVTGFGQESDRQASLDAGFDHHLVKPIDFSSVETLLQRPS